MNPFRNRGNSLDFEGPGQKQTYKDSASSQKALFICDLWAGPEAAATQPRQLSLHTGADWPLIGLPVGLCG